MRYIHCVPAFALALGLFVSTPLITDAAVLPAIFERKTGIDSTGFGSIILAVLDYLKASNAYDASTPDKCKISMYTTSGGHCQTYINCDQNDKKGINLSSQWQVCYVGGRQFFHDDHIGDFSVTFSKAGGVNGDTQDGLHTPILQLADVSNWDPLDVQATVNAAAGRDAGQLCTLEPGGTGTQRLGWVCGVPVIGKKGFGLDSNTAVQTSTFAPGWCTMHIVQYQRDENGVGADYQFDVLIYDNNKQPIGQIQKQPIDPNTKTLNMDSNLPNVMVLTASGGDGDAVLFAYGGQHWGSNDQQHHSNFGRYDSGNREGDTGFTC